MSDAATGRPPQPLRTCPMCGRETDAAARLCPSCGEQLAGPEGTGLWSDGKRLVMERTARLPDRCLKTNATTDLVRFRKTLLWYPLPVRIGGVVLLLVLGCIGLLIALVLMAVFRKSAKVEVVYSRSWRQKRAIGALLGSTVAILGPILILGVTFGFLADYLRGPDADTAMVAGSVLAGLTLIAGLVCISGLWPNVQTHKIDDELVELKGVHKDYLATLPPLNESRHYVNRSSISGTAS